MYRSSFNFKKFLIKLWPSVYLDLINCTHFNLLFSEKIYTTSARLKLKNLLISINCFPEKNCIYSMCKNTSFLTFQWIDTMYNICFTVDLTHLDFIAFLLQCLATLWESKAKKCANFNYRTRANKGRSRLEAAPLTF